MANKQQVKIEGDISGLKTAMKEGAASVSSLNKELKLNQEELKGTNNNVNTLKDRLKLLNDTYDKQKQVVADNEEAYKKSVELYGENSKEAKSLANQLTDNKTKLQKLKNEIDETNKKIEEQTNKFITNGKKLEETGEKWEKIGDKMSKIGNKLSIATAAITGIATAAIKVGADFDSAMSQVQAISGATGEELELLRDKAKEMGASTSKSATESAEALTYMSLAGWDTQQMLEGIEPILRMSEAAGEDLARTSDLVTDSMSALGVEVNSLQRYLDIVTKTQNSSNTSATAMLEAYIECGGTMKNLNVGLEESATWLGVLANRGIKGSEAGNSLNSVLVNLTGGSSSAAEAMKSLGVSAWDSNGNFIGIEATLRKLGKALDKCTEKQKTNFESAIRRKNTVNNIASIN